MRLTIITIFSVVLFSASAMGQLVFNTSPDGLKYKLFTHNIGPKPKIGDVIKFNFMLLTEKDSVIASTFKSVVPVTTTVQTPSYKGDLEEAFMMLSKGDSGVFLVSADSFFSGQQLPDNVIPGSILRMRIKMLNVETAAEYEVKRKKAEAEYNQIKAKNIAEEQAKLDDYMKKNVPNAIKTKDGMYYIIDKPGTGAYPAEKQEIIIHYKGSDLKGKVLESDSGKTTSFIIGAHEVLPGWEIGIAHMNKGCKARLFIPSTLAYGERGVGNIIQPGTTIIYEIELVDIK